MESQNSSVAQDTSKSDVEPGYKLDDVFALDGSRDIEGTTCGIVTEYKGRLVLFYGQDCLGRDCFDEMVDIAEAGFMYEGNVSDDQILRNELGL